MKPNPYLTKSRYLDGLRCEKKLWLGWHKSLPREDAPPFSALDVGMRVGRHVQALFPGGVAVDEEPWDHERARAATRSLMAGDAPALFEAAFEFERVRIRVDVLERLGDGWGLREVKSSTSANEAAGHHDDLAIQLYVLEGSGLDVKSVELIHIDNTYVRGRDGIDWPAMFARQDLSTEIRSRLAQVPARLRKQFSLLESATEPSVRESKNRCLRPYRCERFDTCMETKPDDWVALLPRIGKKQLDALHAQGIDSVAEIPADFELSELQDRAARTVQTGAAWISKELGAALGDFGPPAYYMDFETVLSGIPLFQSTRPFQSVPFQWSLHFVDEEGRLAHQEFLAPSDEDPRRPFSESLIHAVARKDVPVVVYHKQFELRVLKALAEEFADLKPGLDKIAGNVVDLLALVRDHVFDPKLVGRGALTASTFSIKNVLPALVPSLSYADLGEGVSDGMEASRVFAAIGFGEYEGAETESRRAELSKYCALDTRAMVEIRQELQYRVDGRREPPKTSG